MRKYKKYILIIILILLIVIGIWFYLIKTRYTPMPSTVWDPCPNGEMPLEGGSKIHCIPTSKENYLRYCEENKKDIAVSLLCEKKTRKISPGHDHIFFLELDEIVDIGYEIGYSDTDIVVPESRIKLVDISKDISNVRIHCLDTGTTLYNLKIDKYKTERCGVYSVSLTDITPEKAEFYLH